MKAQIKILETHHYTIFHWHTFSTCDQRKTTSLVDSTQQQWSKGQGGLCSSFHSVHQAVCPAGEELWATRKEGCLFLFSQRRHVAGGPGLGWVMIQWSSCPTLPDRVLIPEDGKGACKIYFIP